ncbi:uncharacterized protein LOC126856590 [Cataglyphis hispanica]|uniref:uncharacterized protein LOC126856590 n=1 Tax=Cataglyphis hispanica TaxID=1086592 RepID=UPI0021804DB5|nr:uncharacterized protein LOC126856590 [Cataglyphis hispanica]
MPQGQNSHTTRRAWCTIPSSFGLENLKDYARLASLAFELLTIHKLTETEEKKKRKENISSQASVAKWRWRSTSKIADWSAGFPSTNPRSSVRRSCATYLCVCSHVHYVHGGSSETRDLSSGCMT